MRSTAMRPNNTPYVKTLEDVSLEITLLNWLKFALYALCKICKFYFLTFEFNISQLIDGDNDSLLLFSSHRVQYSPNVCLTMDIAPLYTVIITIYPDRALRQLNFNTDGSTACCLD